MSDDSRVGNRITYKVIGDAVDRYAPDLSDKERTAFIDWNAKSWLNKNLDDATDWNMANEWRDFKNYQEKRGEHPYFRKRGK